MDVPAGSEPLALRPGEPGYDVKIWRGELNRARDAFEEWEKEGADIMKRYALEGEKVRRSSRYNMLWSNVETMAPALYAKPPKMVAARRFLDKDPIGRVASRIIQRAVQYQIDGGEIHEATQMAVLDRLLPGRGVVWCRYEPTIEGGEIADDLDEDFDETGASQDGGSASGGSGSSMALLPGADSLGQGDPGGRRGVDGASSPTMMGHDGPPPAPPRITAEVVHVDYVHWKDFRHDPARTWDEVRWVARRAYMTRDELEERFKDPDQTGAADGQTIGEAVPLTCGPDGEQDEKNKGAADAFRKAEVWEIWDKAKREVLWIATAYEDLLDKKPDLYKLAGFFPCPKPLYATITNGSLVPTPDYAQYKTQAEEMDRISKRKSGLVDAMKVRGAYDAAAPEISRILKGEENELISIDRWDEFSTAQGLKGSIDFLPLDIFAKALEGLSKEKEEISSDVNEITGMSDIVRGQGDPDETATGVAAKGHFATLRLKKRQAEVATFVRDTVRIMAEMTCELFQPETLAEMASCEEMEELQIPAPPPPPMPMPGGMPGMGQPPLPSLPSSGSAGLPSGGGQPLPPQRLPAMAGPGPAPGIGS